MNSSKKKNVKYVELDLKKIFLSLPNTLYEKLITLVFLGFTFACFFGPLTMKEQIDPIRAAITAIIPAFTTSWGLLVLVRYLFFKTRYMVEK